MPSARFGIAARNTHERLRMHDMETKIPFRPEYLAANSSVGRWFKRVGDPVSIAEPLVEIEFDNITVEVLAAGHRCLV